MFHPVTAVLGPGKRFAIWTQGCNRCCEGCMSPESRDFSKGTVWDTNEIANKIIKTEGIEGVTISGGEPFLQAEAICDIIDIIKRFYNFSIIIYSGYLYRELQELDNIFVKKLLFNTDLLIDGPYINEYNDGISLRGSSNQKVIQISKRYENDIGIYNNKERNVEVIIQSDDKARIIGIPPKDSNL